MAKAYLYEDELRERAGRFVERLARCGIEAAVVPDSFRDYTVKVVVSREGSILGAVNLYYSPGKRRYSLRTHELKERSIVPQLEACWDELEEAGRGVNEGDPATPDYRAYVDGSFVGTRIGFGVVIVKDGSVVWESHGLLCDAALLDLRQVAGELHAVHEAVTWCEDNGVTDVTICYDYDGIEKWATGEWKAHLPATQAYVARLARLGLAIRWQKVAAHSGDRWNERADYLARLGAREQALAEEPDAETCLDQKATAFVAFLEARGIAATYRGVLNHQFARVTIEPALGNVDIYHTRKRPLSRPYLHDFSDDALQKRIEQLWQTFLAGEGTRGGPNEDVLAEATYYYQALLPYRHCAFDFVALARALDGACRALQRPGFDPEATRFDFARLEALYHELKGDSEVLCPPSNN